MRTMRTSLTGLLPLLLATACGDGGTGPSLTPEEISGVYHVCGLTFVPDQTIFPAVDIRAAAMDLSADAPQLPRLTIDNQQQRFELAYTPRGGLLPQRPQGTYRTGRTNVRLTWDSPPTVLSALLMPSEVNPTFRASPRQLEFTRGLHDVPRADYARLAGISEQGLAETIRGTISGDFRAGGC